VTQALAGRARIEVVRPTPAEQAQAWREVLGEGSGETAEALAAQFSLSIAAIHAIAERTLAARSAAAATSLRDDLWRACVRHSRPALEGLAQKIEARQPWSALKLPDREAATLARIRDHMRHRAKVHGEFGFREHMSRGLGTAVLFSGESGTGKTLAAEVLAADLGLDLYRIDISGVMNKYIGVTEKNLRQIFDAGDGAILFFDECDALFAKRSEVNDSKDRYANIQVDYLLQRIESYGGLAILATNLRDAIDPAFLRRLRFIVNFPFPGVAERAAIWRNALPPDAPKADLDFDQLGRLQLSGGNIQNVALDAAFRAATAKGKITMALIAEAAQDELRKIDRPPSAAQIRALSSHRQA
jgi:SpoVK/Ycf46/Vps4 family AAA+-type ATPase